MVERMGLAKQWPRSPKSGKFSFGKDTVKDFAKMNPELLPFYELRKTDSALKKFTLDVSADGYNRTFVAPFGQESGRNNPGGGFILGGPKWLRYGVQAPEGHVLIACDVKSEEFVLAAFAEDDDELETYYSGRDLCMDLAIRLGVVPPDADHKTEPERRSANSMPLSGKNSKQSPWVPNMVRARWHWQVALVSVGLRHRLWFRT